MKLSKSCIENMCRYVSLKCNVPFDDLWKDDQLTFKGALSLIVLITHLCNMFTDKLLEIHKDMLKEYS